MNTRTRPQMTLETRTSLIALARDAFGRHGFAGVPMEELCATAGLTRGALYHHFGNKLGLFEAVVAQADDALDEAVESATEAAGGGWQGFRAGCRAYLQAMTAPDIQRIVLHDAPAVIPNFAGRPRMGLCTAQMVAVLEGLMEEGAIRTTDATALANVIAAAVTNAAAWAASRPDPAAGFAAVWDAIGLLLDGLEMTKNDGMVCDGSRRTSGDVHDAGLT